MTVSAKLIVLAPVVVVVVVVVVLFSPSRFIFLPSFLRRMSSSSAPSFLSRRNCLQQRNLLCVSGKHNIFKHNIFNSVISSVFQAREIFSTA